MIHAFDDREHAAASQDATRLAPAGGPEGGKLAPGLSAATKNAPYRKVGAFPFRFSGSRAKLRAGFIARRPWWPWRLSQSP